MPASVGASPGTVVSVDAHSSSPKPRPMPANAASSALPAARSERSTTISSTTASTRPSTSPIGKPPVASPSITSPAIATSTPAIPAVAALRRSRGLAPRSSAGLS